MVIYAAARSINVQNPVKKRD